MNTQDIVAALETLKDKVNDQDKAMLTRIQDSVKSMDQQEHPQQEKQQASSESASDTQPHTKRRGRPKKAQQE